jgi:hypothetical protein
MKYDRKYTVMKNLSGHYQQKGFNEPQIGGQLSMVSCLSASLVSTGSDEPLLSFEDICGTNNFGKQCLPPELRGDTHIAYYRKFGPSLGFCIGSWVTEAK